VLGSDVYYEELATGELRRMTDDDLQKILEALRTQGENVQRLTDILDRLLRMHERTLASNSDIR